LEQYRISPGGASNSGPNHKEAAGSSLKTTSPKASKSMDFSGRLYERKSDIGCGVAISVGLGGGFLGVMMVSEVGVSSCVTTTGSGCSWQADTRIAIKIILRLKWKILGLIVENLVFIVVSGLQKNDNQPDYISMFVPVGQNLTFNTNKSP
jgi:hypothetical protein